MLIYNSKIKKKCIKTEHINTMLSISTGCVNDFTINFILNAIITNLNLKQSFVSITLLILRAKRKSITKVNRIIWFVSPFFYLFNSWLFGLLAFLLSSKFSFTEISKKEKKKRVIQRHHTTNFIQFFVYKFEKFLFFVVVVGIQSMKNIKTNVVKSIFSICFECLYAQCLHLQRIIL